MSPRTNQCISGRPRAGTLKSLLTFGTSSPSKLSSVLRSRKRFPAESFSNTKRRRSSERSAPGSDTKIKAGSEEELILAIGVYKDGHFELTPYPLEAHWAIFAGIAFTHEAKPGEKSVGLGIIFVASGSVQYPPGEFAIAEVGVKVEGQGLIEFRGGDQFLILKGSLAIEFTIAFVLDIEWEIVEGTVYESEI